MWAREREPVDVAGVRRRWCPGAWVVLLTLAASVRAATQALPANHAAAATITADSVYSRDYEAAFVADGKVPEELGRQDLRQAWCVNGATLREGATLTFAWPAPVAVREILYFGRTAWMLSECWRRCEVWCDADTQSALAVELEQRHGPQRLTLPQPRNVSTLRLRFTASYGGANPGASEVMIFSEPVPEAALARFRPDFYESAASSSEETKQALAAAKAGALGFDRLVLLQRRPLNPSHVYTYHVEGLAPGGGLFTLALKDGARTRLVDASEGVLLDAQVSYDGATILFSWKRKMDEPFGIWSIQADGGGLRPLVVDQANNMNACWLPDGGIAFVSDRKPAFAYCWTSTSPVLYRADGDGGAITRLSANYLTDFTPAVAEDGRILFSRWEYVDRPAIPIQSLWAINPDGTMLAGVFGNRVLNPATFMEAREIPGLPGRYLCVMTSHNGPCRGAIGIIDPGRGANAPEAIRNLTPEIELGGIDDAGRGNALRGPYENPFPLDDRLFLVSRAGTILLRDYDGTFESVLCEPGDGPGWYSPQPLRPRPLPHPLPVSRIEPGTPPLAELLLHDVTLGLGDAVAAGEVTRIAVVQEMEKDLRSETTQRQFGFQFPVVSCGATYAPKRVWGFATVEADGSAHFQVPANVPAVLPAAGQPGPRGAAHAHLHPFHARRTPELHRLPCRPQPGLAGPAQRPPAAGRRAPGRAAGRAELGRARWLQLRAGGPTGARRALHRLP
jgi:hypothetical protein